MTLVDAVPKGAGFGTAVPTQTCTFKPSKTTIVCDLGTPVSVGSATVRIVMKPTGQGSVVNVATVAATSPTDPNLGNNVATAVTQVLP